MKLSIPQFDTSHSLAEHKAQCQAARAAQPHYWAVAPGHTLDTPRGELGAGAEVLLSDVADPRSALSAHERMALLVSLGFVLVGDYDCMRRVGYTGPVFRVAAGQSLTTVRGTIIPPGSVVVPADLQHGISSMLELEGRGLVVRAAAPG